MVILLLLNLLGIGLACAAILVLFRFAHRRAAQLQHQPMELAASLSQQYALKQAA